MKKDYEIIREPGEHVPDDEEQRPEPELSGQQRRWYALGAMKSALLIGCVYLAGFAVIIALLLWLWR